MTEIEKKVSPTGRVSLTKAQRESEAGAELLSLCQTVTADGVLSDEEVSSLRDWLQENRDESFPAISHLTNVVEEIIADGQITPEERKQLFIAVEAVLFPEVRAIAKNARRSIEQIEKDRLRLQRELDKQIQRDERERNYPIEHLDFMVAGSRYEGRPALIARFAQVGESVYLDRDPGNKFSRSAVEVRTTSGHQIGFVPEEYAVDIAPLLDAGHPYIAEIKKILTAGRNPIPVVIADIYRKEATLADIVHPRVNVPHAATVVPVGEEDRRLIKFVLIVFALAMLIYLLV